MPRPECPQLQAKGTWGEAQAEDQGGSTLAAKVAQFLAAIDKSPAAATTPWMAVAMTRNPYMHAR
jgi:hypothetical protein